MRVAASHYLLITATVAMLACAPEAGRLPSVRQPAGWDEGIRLPAAAARTPTAGVVELDLDARVAPVALGAAAPSLAWTYGGTLPGPLMRVPQGSRLLIHFTNNLPEATTIHWHGVRLTADMDGVPDHSQPPVPPGGTFDYSFTVPDQGLFWYHPHVRSARQVGDGLYGALLVEPPTAEEGAPGAHAFLRTLGEPLVLVLSDVGVAEDGTLTDPESGGDLGTLFGREGNVVLVNGKIAPTVHARRGLRQRWRMVNTAKSRYFQLAMDGHRFTRIGGDGGLLAAPQETERLVLAPGERVDVVVTPQGEPGARVAVRWIPYDRGFGSFEYRSEVDVFHVQLTADDATEDVAVPVVLRDIAPLDVGAAIARTIDLTQSMVDGRLVLGIDGVPSWQAEAMYARVGDVELWTVNNVMDWDHPFHLHGFFFQPVDPATGAPPARPEWKDTLNVPQQQSVTFAVHYDDRPGMWMFHCHILDHADAGMMGMVHLTR